MTRTMAPRATLTIIASAALFAACTPTGVAPTPGPVTGNSFVVRNVRVFDGSRAIERTNVAVRNGRIESVGRSSPSGLPVVDGTGRTLIPGLIDAHAHVNNQNSLRTAIRFGVTTELDMLSRIADVRALKTPRTTVERSELADAWVAGSPVTSPGGLGTQFGIPFTTLSSPAEAAALVKGRVAEGSDYIKIIYEPGAPIFTTISRETLAAVVQAAHAEGVLAVAHISSLEGARDAVAVGVDGLAHGMSDIVIDAAFAAEIAKRGVFVTPTLSIVGAFQAKGNGSALAADSRLSPYLTPAQQKALTSPGPGPNDPIAPYLVRFDVDRAKQNVRLMKAAGVRILAGTDAPNLGVHGVSLHGELKLLTEAGLSPAEALTAATLSPAQSFKLSDRGVIRPGARADLVLVDGNPLQDIEQTRAIVRIFKNGYEVSRALPAVKP